MGNERKTAIYMRVSVEDNAPVRGTMSAESGSIANQRQYLREYISRDARLADTEILEYSDDGFTGRNMERPGMQKMLNQIRQNRIGCVIVKDMSRFSRDYIEMGTYLNQIFPFMGVDFIAVNDGYDSRERGGEAIVLDTAFRTLLYDLYSKDISVKVKASIDSKCAAGEYVFGQVPLGYEKSREIRNTVIINEREARIVRYIFSLAAGGMGTAQIARKLFEEQIPTATQLRHPDRQPVGKSHTWSATAVRSILDNHSLLPRGDGLWKNRAQIRGQQERDCGSQKRLESDSEPSRTSGDTGNVHQGIPGCTGTLHEKEEGKASPHRKDILRGMRICPELQTGVQADEAEVLLVRKACNPTDTGLLYLFQCSDSGGSCAHDAEPGADAHGRPSETEGGIEKVPDGEPGRACTESRGVQKTIRQPAGGKGPVV